MSSLPDRSTFESAYAGQAPWDIGRPQQAFLDVADRITGSVLDAGCGTGDNALFFASRGHKVTGIDFLEEPVARARRKASERGLMATFLVMDALALKDLPEVFDSVIDSGLFHVFSDEDRKRYIEGLATVLKAGGRLFLLCFSDEVPGTQGPRRVKIDSCSRDRISGGVHPERRGASPGGHSSCCCRSLSSIRRRCSVSITDASMSASRVNSWLGPGGSDKVVSGIPMDQLLQSGPGWRGTVASSKTLKKQSRSCCSSGHILIADLFYIKCPPSGAVLPLHLTERAARFLASSSASSVASASGRLSVSTH
jgi:methyltransferase family protein